MGTMQSKKVLLAITGASGMLFLPPFLSILAENNLQVHGICSESGVKVLEHELQKKPEDFSVVRHWFRIDDFAAAPSSGSSGYDCMVVLPCTMGTLASIASGLSHNLIHRAADVILKESRKLVLAVRETPLNRNHLLNMLRAHEAGAIICPPMPGFYLKPPTLEKAAETFAWRLADQIGLSTKSRKRWQGEGTC